MAESRQDWQLRQLGIIQWTLRRPSALQGTAIITSIPEYVHLLIITKNQISFNNPIVSDVLRALRLNPDQTLQLTPDWLKILPKDFRCNSWQLGVTEKVIPDGVHIVSSELDKLANSSAARRALWQQICEHECDFFSYGK